MTSRSWGIVFLKLLGLYYLVQATFAVGQMIIHAFEAPIAGGPSQASIAALSLTWVLVTASFSGMCLFLTEPLADWLFRNDEPSVTQSAADLVRAGVVLMGIYLLANNVSPVAWFLGETIWFAEGSRQPLLTDYLRQTWRDFSVAFGPLLIGAVLTLRNREIANFAWSLGANTRSKEKVES